MGWDKKVPYDVLEREILKLLSLSLQQFTRRSNKRNAKSLVYSAIALLQLRNGMRCGEAIEAFKYFLKTEETKFEIKPEKTKKKDAKRAVIVPKEIVALLVPLKEAFYIGFNGKLENLKKDNYRMWVLKNLRVNSHTLRKAWETYMALQKELNPELIAKYQGRTNLNVLLDYVRFEEAKEKIEKIIEK